MKRRVPPKDGPFPALVVSLDFELYWGVRDKRGIRDYKDWLEGVQDAVPRLLRTFAKREIHATWATVGFLFASDAAELRRYLPKIRPLYVDQKLSPYPSIEVGTSLAPRHLHFAPELIDQIRQVPGQEIGSHTFSHYYCLAEGQTMADFEADLEAFSAIAQAHDVSPKSIVFPRNQVNRDYLNCCKKQGHVAYRGTEKAAIHQPVEDQKLLMRATRYLDAHLNLTGHHTYGWSDLERQPLVNVRASRFLRPFSPQSSMLNLLSTRRVIRGIHHAAANNGIFHLWWHPHNFGKYLDDNMARLEEILDYFERYRHSHRMQSLNMSEVAEFAKSMEVAAL